MVLLPLPYTYMRTMPAGIHSLTVWEVGGTEAAPHWQLVEEEGGGASGCLRCRAYGSFAMVDPGVLSLLGLA